MGLLLLAVGPVRSAPYAAMVMDARTGQVLYSENADARLHPASLTKMMTLYIAFEAIGRGEISLDTMVTVSAKAANEQPSKLGLRAGQKIKLRYLIRAAAIKSANDCATAIGEAIEGSEAAFARRMNRTAKALGMTRTTFKNANGLTESGHLSTARDMTILGRRLFYDHPAYYNLFSRRSSDAGGKTVANTNRRFLDAYPGADGIKTGYTVAAGFNLVASAQHGDERIIATMFGGTSTAARNKKVAELLDLGFRKAPANVREKKPDAPVYADVEDDPQVVAPLVAAKGAAARTIRVVGAPEKSVRPLGRPGREAPVAAPAPDLLASIQDDIQTTLAAVAEEEGQAQTPTGTAPAAVAAAPPRPGKDDEVELAQAPATPEALLAEALAGTDEEPAEAAAEAVAEAAPAPEAQTVALAAAPPPGRPAEALAAAPAEDTAAEPPAPLALAELAPALEAPAPGAANGLLADLKMPATDPATQPEEDATLHAEAGEAEGGALLDALSVPNAAAASPRGVVAAVVRDIRPEVFVEASAEPAVVTRLSTSGGRDWGINVGIYNSRYEAEKVLLRTALMEIGTLDEALRKVGKSKKGFEANFLGMTEDLADLACRRLTARGVECKALGPSS